MLDTTLCEIRKGRKLLLKKATRGVSKGKWNALGGKIEKGEGVRSNAIREVFEESGLRVRKLRSIGTIDFYRGSRKNLFIKMHLFSCDKFSGRMRSTEEGRLKWFRVDSLPYDKMWDDDLYWMPIFLKGMKFDAEFVYDNGMKRVLESRLMNVRK